MNIHVNLTGDVAKTIEEMIYRGRAASKSEAIRLAVLEYRQKLEESNKQEKNGWLALAEKSLDKVWNNKKDDEVWSKY